MQIALSWHESAKGIEILTVPGKPGTGPWRLERIFPLSQDEALSAGDIDRDGKLDLLLGTVWLRNEGSAWHAFPIDPGRTKPDRNRLADINGDGRLDAIVGFEAISRLGDVVWYEQGVDPRLPWKRHRVGTVTGPMSLDVADFDGDGDLDIMVGEHNLKNPETARLVLFENVDGRGSNWRGISCTLVTSIMMGPLPWTLTATVILMCVPMVGAREGSDLRESHSGRKAEMPMVTFPPARHFHVSLWVLRTEVDVLWT
ncbi:MAG: VCBS repeat-containing protein [Acidobacteria bacterium]|nr:VCBS repeat-containing protein [Acidobacteriota bacterium]